LSLAGPGNSSFSGRQGEDGVTPSSQLKHLADYEPPLPRNGRQLGSLGDVIANLALSVFPLGTRISAVSGKKSHLNRLGSLPTAGRYELQQCYEQSTVPCPCRSAWW
jgi:hypothetical protein